MLENPENLVILANRGSDKVNLHHQRCETKAVFGLVEQTRFQLVLFGTVPGRTFNKVP
jgi:hypothetical protein